MADMTEQIDPSLAEPAPKGDAAADSNLPEDVLKVPAISAMLNGSPPAVFTPAGSKSPELEVLEKNLKQLAKAGFALYQTKDKANFVLFNQLFVSPEEIQQADDSGNLESVAAPFDAVNADMNAAMNGGESAAPVAEAAPAAGKPPTSTESRNLATKRINNVQPGSPTDGARPGQGRLLNNIQKTVL